MAHPAPTNNNLYMPTEDFSSLSIGNSAIPEAVHSTFDDPSTSFLAPMPQLDTQDYYTAQAADGGEAPMAAQEEDDTDGLKYLYDPDVSEMEPIQLSDGRWMCNWLDPATSDGGGGKQKKQLTPCKKVWDQKCALTKHQKNHSMPYKCPHCADIGVRKGHGERKELIRHCRLVHPESPQAESKRGQNVMARCEVCQKQMRKDNVKRHKKTCGESKS